ncbi:MAG: single-stranded-DNA-specific exonuclease RecJ [Patescibacteria group bacterium]|nr:single-stranded-DNA-specific exonuclease RecJ [Patescibacteria group bacterium]
MSILNKNWQLLNDSDKDLFTKILHNRGLDSEQEINEFLEPEKYVKFHDPMLFDDMEKAVGRIKKAIKDKERIIVFGDYDVDGISGTTILVKALEKLGANVSYRLPHRRDDGYGLKEKFIEEFVELGVSLVITTDCGISCVKEVALANKNKIDIIITDHHAVPKKLPKAFAIIHPEVSGYPFKELTGAGVALKLAQALHGRDLEEFVDLAAMGTVADIGILVGENRLIVKKGLDQLAKTASKGLRLLKEIAGISNEKINTRTIGYQIGPRINAAGRIDNPYFALQLLLSEDEVRGRKLANKLEDLNKERQFMLQEALEEAEARFAGTNDKFILIKESKDWHVGILGLVAGRLAEKYQLPVIILQDFGDVLTASARSPEHFNIIEALTAHSKHLNYFGGHACAAGFDIDKKNFKKFREAMEKYAEEKLKEKDLRSILKIDCEIKGKEINKETLAFIEKLHPFGTGNQSPNFLIKNIKPLKMKEVGKDKSHLKILAEQGQKKLDIIAFKFAEHLNTLREHDSFDLVCNIERNPKNRYNEIQIKAVDFKKL